MVTCDFGSRVIDDSLSLCIYNDRNLSVHLSPLHTVKYGNVSSVCCLYLMIADFTNLRCLYWCTWYGQMHVLAFALLECTLFFPFTGWDLQCNLEYHVRGAGAGYGYLQLATSSASLESIDCSGWGLVHTSSLLKNLFWGLVWHPGPGLNRINRIFIPTSCNFFFGSRSLKNSEVKRAWPREI